METKQAEINIYDFFSVLIVPSCFEKQKIGLFDEEICNVDPKRFFVTSGEALQRTRYLHDFYVNYLANVRKQHKKIQSTESELFIDLCKTQVDGAKKILKKFIEIRGNDIFLETFWHEDKLTVTGKNPRIKKSAQIGSIKE